jgi:hypothetical protein
MSYSVIKLAQRHISTLQITQFKQIKAFGHLRVLKKKPAAIFRIFGVCLIKFKVMAIMLEYMLIYAW